VLIREAVNIDRREAIEPPEADLSIVHLIFTLARVKLIFESAGIRKEEAVL